MKFVLACGGSGGHIFPAFSLAEEIRRRRPDADVVYLCGKKDVENEIFRMVPANRSVTIDSAPLSAVFTKPDGLIKLISGFRQSVRYLKRERPAAVVGFGGYHSVPAVLAAKSVGLRSVIHEQNVVPGAANKFLARFADGVALSYEETRTKLPGRRVIVTGNPIRSSIERECRAEALEYFGFDAAKRTLLVLGGSQGAESINTLFLGCLPKLGETFRRRLQVLHLCGRMRPGASEETMRRWGVEGKAFSFFDRMDLAYGAADAALGRAGATFLAEIAVKRVPAVLVPYPYAGGHQSANAEAFRRATGRAVVAEQKDLTEARLAELLTGLVEKPAAPGNAVSGAEARKWLANFVFEVAGVE